MNKVLVCSLLLLLGALVHTEAQAQLQILRNQEARSMKGLEALEIVVKGLDDDSRACNINNRSMESAVIATLDNSRIIVDRPENARYLFKVGIMEVSVLTVRPNNGCVSVVSVRVWRPLMADGELIIPIIFHDFELLTGPPSGFGTRVSNALVEMTREMIATWIEFNPR